MAQCKKILDNGEQCSNRAAPGSDYCDTHRRIQFRRVTPTPPTPPPAGAGEPRAEPPPPRWTARPAAAGAAPVFPGLRPDVRNVLVAPAGCVWLGDPDAGGGRPAAAPLFERLARLLAALSQALPLAGHVSVRVAPQGGGVLVSLRPPQPEPVDLSRLYDAVADAAALSGGTLYVGQVQERLWIQYRDGSAPRGYDLDVSEFAPLPPGETWYLVDAAGAHPLSPAALSDAPLRDLLLRVAPLPARGVALPEVAFVLAAPPLYRMLAGYFRAHHLQYRVARFYASPSSPPAEEKQGKTLLLFELAPRPDAPTGACLPAFALSYLDDLPRCAVLTTAAAEGERRMLVEWRSRYPCQPSHTLGVFPQDSLVLFNRGPDFENLCVAPAPHFFEGDALTEAHTPAPAQADLAPLDDAQGLPLSLPVRLVHDPGPTPATGALVLDREELAWVRRLLYRLPGEAFTGYTLCVGQAHAALVGEGLPVEALPFGVPLRRVQDTQLFIPLRARFAPDLPWNLLAESLQLRDDTYTFLTPELRLDAPRRGFAPLSRALAADPDRPRVRFEVQPAAALPALEWTPRERPAAAAPPVEAKVKAAPPRAAQGEKPGLIERLFGSTAQSPADGAAGVSDVSDVSDIADLAGWLRAQAQAYRDAGDHLSAALCFALLDDAVEAGRCYRRGARERLAA